MAHTFNLITLVTEIRGSYELEANQVYIMGHCLKTKIKQ